ncbi:MAG: hypothetical protein ACKO6N_11585 [Myxococcota bacterium]
MKPWLTRSLLMVSLSCLWPHAGFGAEETEYRAVTLIDGTLYRGVVVSADADNLVLRTLEGDRTLSLMDIVQVDELEREVYLTAVNRRWIFLGIEAPASARPRMEPLEAALLELLQRPDLLTVSTQSLDVRLRQVLEGCTDSDCRLEAVREEGLPVIYGVLRGKGKQEQVILRRLDRSLNQVKELAIPVLDPRTDRARLVSSIALLLGEKPPAPETQATPPVTGPAPSAAPEKTSPEKVATAETSPNGTTAATPHAGTTAAATPSKPTKTEPTKTEPTETLVAERQTALKLDLLPVPGASSLMLYRDPVATAGAAVAVGTLTGMAVYLTGDMRALGLEDGLPVGWTYPDRGPRDALLLGGVGAATYLVSTLVVNQVVRIIQVNFRGH